MASTSLTAEFAGLLVPPEPKLPNTVLNRKYLLTQLLGRYIESSQSLKHHHTFFHVVASKTYTHCMWEFTSDRLSAGMTLNVFHSTPITQIEPLLTGIFNVSLRRYLQHIPDSDLFRLMPDQYSSFTKCYHFTQHIMPITAASDL